MKLRLALSLVVSTSALTGCAALSALTGGALGPSVSESEAKAAIQAKDYEKLKPLCTGEIDIRTHVANNVDDTCTAAIAIAREKKDVAYLAPLCVRTKESFGARFGAACAASLDLAIERDDGAAIDEVCKDGYHEACTVSAIRSHFGDLTHPHCASLAKDVVAAVDSFMKPNETRSEVFGRVVGALARCDEGATIFEKIAHIGNGGASGYGTRVLLAAHEVAGEALDKALTDYLASHQGKAFLAAEHGEYAADHLAQFLVAEKRDNLCEPLATAAKDAAPKVQAALMSYFVAFGCTKAAPLAVGLLASDVAEERRLGCVASGKLADASALPKLGIVADSDTTSRVVERPEGSGVFMKERYVSDACREAMGKIQLRAN